MPVASRCPQCDRLVQVPEELFGQLVQCPSCGATFTAGSGARQDPPMVLPVPQPPVETPPAPQGPYIDLGPKIFGSEPRRDAEPGPPRPDDAPPEPRRYPPRDEPP